MMAEESVPHVSLALHPKHQAKDLGPMVKRAVECTNWTLTQAPNEWYSPSCKTYRLEAPGTNLYVALTNLTPDQKWFTCIDLANAFFCLPLSEELRDIFSFTHKGRQWRYTRLPQGFALSPGIFNQVLREALQGCCLPTGVTLVQYVDDLLLAAPTVAACIQATMTVLTRLAEKGFEVSKEKLQLVRTQVSFLGRVISQKGAGLSPAHRTTILHHPKPTTVQEMLSFLGLTGYSHNYIPNYSGLTGPLRALVKEQGMRKLKATIGLARPTRRS
uniref:ribonuclease H n=1 Tax=Esox lucius TaxID=8010 RepID=A0AAY5KZ03_ESOLU